ncbi:MAG: hypothetical protein EOO43_26100 [Flavobacterium sp.]|nr:MAG: hypothetical protein EOO43_26100 [Flavobacterium sp.]
MINLDHLKCMAFSPDRSLIISGFFDGTIKVIDREAKKTIHTFSIHQTESTSKSNPFNGFISN